MEDKMEFEVNDMTTLPKFWITFIDGLTEKSKDLLLYEFGVFIERQQGIAGLERKIDLFQEQFKLREKKKK